MKSLTNLQKSMLGIGECLGVDLEDSKNIVIFDDFRNMLHISKIEYSLYPNCIENKYLIEYGDNLIRTISEVNTIRDSKLITGTFDEEMEYSYRIDNIQQIREYTIKDNRMEVSKVDISQTALDDTMNDGDYAIIHFASIMDVDYAKQGGILSNGVIMKREVDILDLPDNYELTDGIRPFIIEKGKVKRYGRY